MSMELKNIFHISRISFLAEPSVEYNEAVLNNSNRLMIAALISSVLIHIFGCWFLIHIGNVSSQQIIRPIEVSIVDVARPKKIIPLPLVMLNSVHHIQVSPRSMRSPVLSPVAKRQPVPIAERSILSPDPIRIPEKKAQSTQPVPAVPSLDTRSAVSSIVSVPSASGAPAVGVVRGGGTPSASEGSEGDSVIGPSYNAAYLSNPPPNYPAVARRLKLQGTATIRVLVTAEGRPKSVTLETSSGSRILDEAALDAVQHWSFVPARRGRISVSAEVDVPVRFHLY